MANLFSFNAQTETPDMLARRRAVADQLAGQIGGGTPNYGAGIGDLFRGMGAGFARYRADQSQRAGEAGYRSAADHLAELLDRPPGSYMPASPTNDALGASVRSAIATGQPPQLATYTPPMAGQGPDAGMTQPNIPQAPQMAAQPIPEPMAPQALAPPEMPPQPQDNGAQAMLSKIDAVLRNPWIPDTDKQLLMQRRAQIAQQTDPAYQMEMQAKQMGLEKSQLDIASAKIDLYNKQNPQAPVEKWQDPNTGDLYAVDLKNGTKHLVAKAGEKPSEGKVVPKGSMIYENGKWVSPPVPEGSGAAQVIDDPMKISKQYENSAGFSRMSQIAPTLKSMYRSIGDPTAMADLDFVYGLAKIMDPTSVVRESEGRMVVESQGMAPQLLGQLNKILNGEQAMSQQTRLNLFTVAQRRVGELESQTRGERSFFANMAKENGFNPDTYIQPAPTMPHLIPEQNQPQMPGQAPAVQAPAVQAPAKPWVDPTAAKPQSKAEYDALPPGTRYIAPDGKVKIKP